MTTSCVQTPYVLILDDHPLVDRGIAHFLASIRPDLDIKVVTHRDTLRDLPNKRMARLLGITESTVREHVTSILGRLGVYTHVELMTVLRGRRLVCGPGP